LETICSSRECPGTITTFDPPGSTFINPFDINFQLPVAINPAGAITGYFFDASLVSHGFLRSK
jgi:hypothetical protein